MKAILLSEPNQPLTYKEIDTPSVADNEVLVRVKAAALNHRDVWITKGMYPGIVPNIVLGSDGAGIVERVGSEVAKDWIGKSVIINPSLNWKDDPKTQPADYKILGLPDHGTFAEYVKVKAENLVEKPAYMSFEAAAAIPLAGLTAYRALMTRARCSKNDKVLISGVGGGVALFAFQFAIAIGAEVYVTSGSPAKIEKAIALGAKGGANYKAENWSKELARSVGGFDVIVDSAGGEGFNHLIRLANHGGRIVLYGGTRGNIPKLNPQKIFWKQLSIFGSTMGNSEEFQQMVHLMNNYQVQPVVDEVFPLSEAQKAFDKMGQGKQFGKIVLKM